MLQEIAMAYVRLSDGGPHWSCNQAIVQRAEEEADEEVQHWSDSDVSESELADAFREIQEVTNKMGLRKPHQEKRPENAKKPETSMLVKPSRGPPILQLHVVMVIDASLSMGTEDVDLLMDRKGSDVQLPVTVRRIDAVFHSCLSFLQAFRATNVTEERFSLVVFNSQAQVVFERLGTKEAAAAIKRIGTKVNPKRETKFLTAFQAVSKLLGNHNQALCEDVRVVFLSDGKPYETHTVMKHFDKQVLQKMCVQTAQSFELHAVAFGSQSDHWHHLRSLAEVTHGTFQISSLDQLQLGQAFTSIADTITSTIDQNSSGQAPLKFAAMDKPFDPLCNDGKCLRQCNLIKHSHQKQRWKYVDEEKVLRRNIHVTVNNHPFNCGGMRLVFDMTDSSDMNKQYAMVAKRLIQKAHAEKEDMLHFCRCTSLAFALRTSFLDALKRKHEKIAFKIWFVPCYLYEYESGGGTAYFVGEQKLQGDFVKFNGNNGYVNSKEQLQTESEILQALSHYSFVTSKGSIMLVDLQGVVDKGTILLTDPQVLSKTRRYGRGDLGYEGFSLFFEHHHCGPTCHKGQ